MAVKLGYKNVYRDPEGYPEWEKLGLPVEITSGELTQPITEQKQTNPLSQGSLIWKMLAVFVSGIALSFTPCVYPMIPTTISFFGGRSGWSRRRLILHGLSYVAGLSVTNSALGVAAAFTGGMMGVAKASGLKVFAIGVREMAEQSPAWSFQHYLSYPVMVDPEGEIFRKYGNGSVLYHVLIDRHFKIIHSEEIFQKELLIGTINDVLRED